ncbi:MAG: glycoside hydrolase family 3 C-terminal domain-containing protein, partial [Gemmatimonadota bacterium]
GRDYNSVDVSDRTLRSVDLPTCHAAVNAGVATIMAAFTALNGVPSTANEWLLTGILREEWGFQGVVVSDYDAVPELENHRIAATDADAVALAMRAGVNVDLHSLTYADELPGLVRSGRVSEASVDSAVRRVLRLKFRLGLFDDPFRYDDPARAKAVTLSPSQRALARRAAEESFVLLENRGVLPLSPGLKTIAVLGPLANNSADPLGPVHAVGRPSDTRTVLDGIRQRLGAGVRVLYARGTAIGILSPAGAAGTSNAASRGGAATGPGAADTSGIAHAAVLAKQADAAVVVVGEAASMSGEGGSRSRLDLPGAQLALVKAVVATGTPTVVVLMSGRPLTIPWLSEHAPALLEAWFPGTEAGSAIAGVLFGDAEPGGRLPSSFPRDVGQIPIFYAHRNTGRPPVASDRYTSKYLDVANSPLYPFGYGLGYTRFAYSDVRVDRARMAVGDTVHVSVTVKNIGRRAGTDVVQLYVTDEEASVAPVVERLRGFRRVRLAPGKSRRVSFPLTAHDLALYSVDMKRYAAEPGFFTVSVGANSRDAHAHQARFELVEGNGGG